jgi:hypothetical protein
MTAFLNKCFSPQGENVWTELHMGQEAFFGKSSQPARGLQASLQVQGSEI